MEALLKSFKDIYGDKEEIRIFQSPGRVNLIGEHIDYNGGLVFPCALDFGTIAIVRKREDSIVNLASTNFDLKVEVDLNDLVYKEVDDWANYPKGVMKIMRDHGYTLGGIDILISGNIPNGAGLSSSASLEVLIGEIINVIFNKSSIDMVEIVKMSQEAENKFVGVNCGIMDQFAVGMGKSKKAILLNCATLEYKYADVELGDYKIVLMNTNKRRALNESKYNERRAECDKVLERINSKRDNKIENLCDLSMQELEIFRSSIQDEILIKRVTHVIGENERVKDAFEALNKGELNKFGELLTESHNSLRDLYEVTGIELDTLAEEAIKIHGCLGARMTGAGFGGCAIALVKSENEEEFIAKLTEVYTNKIGYAPSFYSSGIGNGACELNLVNA